MTPIIISSLCCYLPPFRPSHLVLSYPADKERKNKRPLISLFFIRGNSRSKFLQFDTKNEESSRCFYRCTFVSWTVTGATDCGLLEGVLRGQGTGLFPAHCVQEVRLRHTNIPLGPQPSRDGRNPRVLGRRESQHKYFATAPRLKKP